MTFVQRLPYFLFFSFQLSQGVLVKVSPSLIVQDKQRMHDLPCGARVIFGANGYVFISPTTDDQTSSYAGNMEEVKKCILVRFENVG